MHIHYALMKSASVLIGTESVEIQERSNGSQECSHCEHSAITYNRVEVYNNLTEEDGISTAQ